MKASVGKRRKVVKKSQTSKDFKDSDKVTKEELEDTNIDLPSGSGVVEVPNKSKKATRRRKQEKIVSYVNDL